MGKKVGSINLFFDNIEHENMMLLNTDGQTDSMLTDIEIFFIQVCSNQSE